MPFDRLPGRLGPIPDWKYTQAPAPHVAPTGEIVGNAMEKLEKLAKYLSPYETKKRELELSTLESKSNWYKKYGILNPSQVLAFRKDQERRAREAQSGYWNRQAYGRGGNAPTKKTDEAPPTEKAEDANTGPTEEYKPGEKQMFLDPVASLENSYVPQGEPDTPPYVYNNPELYMDDTYNV